jgi:hypothetical protein
MRISMLKEDYEQVGVSNSNMVNLISDQIYMPRLVLSLSLRYGVKKIKDGG